MQCTIDWLPASGMAFAAETASGHVLVMDGAADGGGRNLAPRPMETVLAGTGGCTAYDVVLILQRGRHDVRGCRVQMTSERAPTDTLPSYQQWVLGGVNNLTAYLPGTIVGDRGYLGRLALQGPQWSLGPMKLSANAFTEYGASRYSYIPVAAPMWQALNDVGASLSVALPVAHTSLMLAYAKPVGSRNVSAALRQGQQSHVFFYLQAAL